MPTVTPKPKLLEQMRAALRTRHYSYRTEEAYVGWIRRFIFFHGKRHPNVLGKEEVSAFLTALAVDRHVSASTQNQALAALLFLYREVLDRDLDWLDDLVRAKRGEKLPVVLSRGEVAALLSVMTGLRRLQAALLYGTGLRLLECLRLRVKDLDFERHEIVVREGKGQKDRITLFPTLAAGAVAGAPRAGAGTFMSATWQRGMGRSGCRTPWQRSTPTRPGSGRGNGYFRRRSARWIRAAGSSGAIIRTSRYYRRRYGSRRGKRG